jgi:hypothetical protein
MTDRILKDANGRKYINNESPPIEDEKDIEIARLRKALYYEANRFQRIGTHAPDCWKWGPQHYECALRHIKEQTENWSNHD